MDEKIMEVLAKLLQGQTEMRTEMDGMKNSIAHLESNMARMESRLTEKIDALFDGQKVQQDVNQRVLERLEILETKMEDLQLQTAHVRVAR